MTSPVPRRRAILAAVALLLAAACVAVLLVRVRSSADVSMPAPISVAAPAPAGPRPVPAGIATKDSRTASVFTVCVQPLGAHDPTLVGPVGRGIAQAYGFSVRRLDPRPMPAAAWYPPRSRHRAQRVLDHLLADVLPAEAGCDAMVGFTSADVSTTMGEHPDWGVLGLAYLGNRVAVVSSFRMRRDADRRRQVERAVKVVIHELGHVVGVPHRDDGPRCIMNDAGGSVRSVDRASGALCAAERAAAEAALGFDLPVRDGLDWGAIEGASGAGSRAGSE